MRRPFQIDKSDLILMIIHRCGALFFSNIPQLHQAITSCTNELHTGVDEIHSQYRVCVPFERLQTTKVLQAPQLDGLVTASSRKHALRSAELDTPYAPLMAFTRPEKSNFPSYSTTRLCILYFPDLCRSVLGTGYK